MRTRAFALAFSLAAAGALAALIAAAPLAAASAYVPAPVADRRPVTDVYHGVKVVDDYRWLEDAKDPAVRRWIDEQNEHTRAYFDRLHDLDQIRRRVEKLVAGSSADYFALRFRKGLFFALKSQPPKNQ